MEACGIRWRRDRGAAAVEAALVLPLLLLLVFGIIDFGRMLNAQIKVTEAAREGARASSLNANVANRIQDVMGSLSNVEVAEQQCGSNPGAGADAQVVVRYSFEFVTPFSALAGLAGGPITLTSTGVMPCRA